MTLKWFILWSTATIQSLCPAHHFRPTTPLVVTLSLSPVILRLSLCFASVHSAGGGDGDDGYGNMYQSQSTLGHFTEGKDTTLEYCGVADSYAITHKHFWD